MPESCKQKHWFTKKFKHFIHWQCIFRGIWEVLWASWIVLEMAVHYFQKDSTWAISLYFHRNIYNVLKPSTQTLNFSKRKRVSSRSIMKNKIKIFYFLRFIFYFLIRYISSFFFYFFFFILHVSGNSLFKDYYLVNLKQLKILIKLKNKIKIRLFYVMTVISH